MSNQILVFNFLLCIFSITGLSAQDKSYEELWTQVKEFRNQAQPRSAFNIVKTIYSKASHENNYEQLIKSIIYKTGLALDFEDRDPIQNILDFEDELEKMNSRSAKAVMHSVLGEMYHHYGMQNLGRFSDRSSEKNIVSAFSSLDAIQKKSIEHYAASIISDHDINIIDFEEIMIAGDNNIWNIQAETIESFLLYRAIDHYMNTAAFATLTTGNLVLDDPALFESGVAFLRIALGNKNDDYRRQCLGLFQLAESSDFVTESNKQKLYFKRLDYVRSNYDIAGADDLYLKALNDPKIQSWEEGLAYSKIIQYQLDKAEQNNEAGNLESKEAFAQAFRYIQKFLTQFPDSKIMDIVKHQRQRLISTRIEIELESIVPADQDFLFYLAYRNVPQAYIHIFELDDRTDALFKNSNTPKDKLSVLNKANKVKSWSVNLPATGDYNYHGIEIPVDGLDFGRYIIIVSDHKDLKYRNLKELNLAYFTSSNLAYYSFYENGNYKGKIIDRSNGDPLTDVKVELREGFYNPITRSQEYKYIKTLYTDNKGIFDCSGLDSKRFRFKFINGKDTLAPDDDNYNYRQNSGQKSTREILLFTDRGIYRPGQTVHFKTILFNKNADGTTELYKDGYELKVYLKDVNNQIVNSLELKTNKYGSANGQFIIPQGNLNGQYSLTLDNPFFSHYFSVEEYKRPGILAGFDSITENYILGDTIKLLGHLKTFSGLHVEGAEVRYQVVKRPRRWFYRSYYNSPDEIVKVAYLTTDSNGEFQIDFESEGQYRDNRFEYEISCDIKDITGESTQLNKTIILSKVPYQLQIDMPESTMAGDSWTTQIRAKNLEGQLLDISVEASILKLVSPLKYKKEKYWPASDQFVLTESDYKSRFPNEKYKNLAAEAWETVDTIDQINFSGRDIQTSDLSQVLSEGVFKILFDVTDQDGNKTSDTRILYVSGKENRVLPTRAIWSTGLKASYQPGDRVDLQVMAPFKNYDIQYFISQGEDILSSGSLNKKKRRIEWLLDESHRGGLSIKCIMVKHNRIYEEDWQLMVPWSNKNLNIEITKIDNTVLPGSEQSIHVKVRDENDNPVVAEILASMYDSRLDAFASNDWRKVIYPEYNYGMRIVNRNFRKAWVQNFRVNNRNQFSLSAYRFYPEINFFGFEKIFSRYHIGIVAYRSNDMLMKSTSPGQAGPEAVSDAEGISADGKSESSLERSENLSSDQVIRDNLKETVFFYPSIKTDENGEAVIDYKMNDALTKWKLSLFAHDNSLSYGLKDELVQTSKPLMVEAFLPRFLRQQDSIDIQARVSNNSGTAIEVNSSIRIFEALTQVDLTDQFVDPGYNNSLIKLNPGESKSVAWPVMVPEDCLETLIFRIKARSKDYSDTEQHLLTSVTNKAFVTEALPLYCGPHATEQFEFQSLQNSGMHPGRSSEKLRLEYVPDPSWMILKSLPAMMSESDYKSMELMEGIYAALLGRSLLDTQPRLRSAIRNWQNHRLQSPLNQSEEYKQLSIQQTPWLNDALREELNMQKLEFLLDDNTFNYTLDQNISKLILKQQPDGGFAWIEGGKSNWYVTQYILELIVRLNEVNVGLDNKKMENLVSNAVRYIDEKFLEYYDRNKILEPGVPPMIAQYLYVRHYSKLDIGGRVHNAISDYLKQGRKQWMHSSTYIQSLLGRTYFKTGDSLTVEAIKTSLDERMIRNDKTGYYWNDQAGYYWYELNLDKQASLIEFYKLVDADKVLLDGMRLWLLKNKQLNSWKTGKATASAVYSFYDKSDSPDTDGTLSFSFPNSGEEFMYDVKSIPDQQIKVEWTDPEIIRSNSVIEIENSTAATGWGALFLQYFENMDEVTSFTETPVMITKSIGYVKLGEKGEELQIVREGDKLKVGDRLRSRILISVDRPMEYVLLEDKRASGLEPINVLSSYKWQDGLAYYEVTEDKSSKFFIEFLPKGNFVFEYDVFVSHAGKFTGGLSVLQSMYAPEFTSHSAGLILSAGK